MISPRAMKPWPNSMIFTSCPCLSRKRGRYQIAVGKPVEWQPFAWTIVDNSTYSVQYIYIYRAYEHPDVKKETKHDPTPVACQNPRLLHIYVVPTTPTPLPWMPRWDRPQKDPFFRPSRPFHLSTHGLQGLQAQQRRCCPGSSKLKIQVPQVTEFSKLLLKRIEEFIF